MRFALIDDKLIEAGPKLKGLCPGCFQPVIAKCGIRRIHHWAHHDIKNCDSWSEPETQWHRYWKNHFPIEWQETFLPDKQTGEKHIADIRTSHGLVIEFQHSQIHPQERASRENFYKNMVWVVDGKRLKRDHPRFLKGKTNFQNTDMPPGFFLIDYPDECFPSSWLGCSVPVMFDFSEGESMDDLNDVRNDLYCLFPSRIGGKALLAVISRKAFIDAVTNGKLVLWVRNWMNNIIKINQEWQNELAKQQQLQDSINFRRFPWSCKISEMEITLPVIRGPS